ncbi:isoamylase early set domain-containing protein [Desertivirga xinjiangensis]|uniref:isoamylase early set domain-containing protein n=1 Tax=Desertivirga xinjiangensis TaxID=539206 RepID=UPI00210AA7B8|nr:isoamylase early set domain-containing protein [Pedobacter xinjiangensis]
MLQKTYVKSKDLWKVKFTFKHDSAETVEILGLNSDWENSIPLSKKKDGSFSTEITLPKNSQHEFKYRVNKTEWMEEPEADDQNVNAFGSTNSVLILN